MEKHSEKGLNTIAKMNTTAADWAHVEIKWVKEMRLVPTKIMCPHCGGHEAGKGYPAIEGSGRTYIVTGTTDHTINNEEDLINIPQFLDLLKKYCAEHAAEYIAKGDKDMAEYYDFINVVKNWKKNRPYAINGWMDMAKGAGIVSKGVCPHCLPSRKVHYGGRFGSESFPRAAGFTIEPRMREVMVGYPQWAEGTKFDSRFRHADCDLCGKNVYKSRLYPVAARGADGVYHGMWVGADCAKKFLGIKNFKKLKDNEMYEVPADKGTAE